ncbi:MAG: OmpH family outer membrane protein [Kiritimatiellae bacterium]|nr:OmpH family outer membrane protein [Kiritimatiellia bacterium]
MKKATLLILAAAVAASASAVKIGTVDMLLLVRNHATYESNKTLLLSTEKDYRKKLDEMKAELDAIQVEGHKVSDELRNPMLAPKAKAEAEKSLQSIQNRFLQKQQMMRNEAMRNQQELSALEARLLKAQADDLKKTIAAFASANGYDIILDNAASIYSKGSLDVTDAILKKMGVDPATARAKEQ